jgi:GNAT superfamily N-acetyltransferase
MVSRETLRIDPATPADVPLLFTLVKELAAYEKLAHEVTGSESGLMAGLFGAQGVASAVIARVGDTPAGFALYFFNYSTFLTKPGLYLEDLFVRPEWRGRGIGRVLLVHLARIAVERGCGRMEWSVLDWNELALGVYRAIGAQPLNEWTVQRLTGDSLIALAAGVPATPPASAP